MVLLKVLVRLTHLFQVYLLHNQSYCLAIFGLLLLKFLHLLLLLLACC